MTDERKGVYRWWMCTWNNPQEDTIEIIKNCGAQYGRGQKERGVEGTLHIQFVLFFRDSQRFNKVKSILAPAVHLEGKPGAAKKDICNYVWKDDTAIPDTRFEFGRSQGITQQGQEKYLDAIQKAQDTNILDACPEILVKHLMNLVKLEALFAKPYSSDECRGVWIFGEPGSGKSHLARELSGESLYVKSQNKWWDGYRGARSVLLDDLDSPQLGHLLKIWLDKWAAFGELKGGTVALQHNTFYITSNYLPRELWPELRMRTAVERRCRFVYVDDRRVTWGTDFGNIPDVAILKRTDRIEIFPGMFLE